MKRISIASCMALMLITASSAMAASPGAAEALLSKYEAIAPSLTDNPFGASIHVESSESDDLMQGDVYGIVDVDLKTIGESLTTAPDWCKLAALHMNVKAAVAQQRGTNTVLTLYVGRKNYQRPSQASRLDYDFLVEDKRADYLSVAMTCEDGPHGTTHHRLAFEAIPLPESRSFIHMRYACNYGLVARTGLNAYLVTLGRKRVGFSVVGRDRNGRPVYVKGVRGIVERNAMRYYLAVKTCLTALSRPADERFECRIALWFDEIMRYPAQLDDLKREEYLAFKRKEREQSELLQRKLDGR